jgi:hypothetical protein
MSSPEQAHAYYNIAQEVLTELGLRDRCRVTDISARQDSYRWCLLFELNGNTFALKGNESAMDTADQESIRHKLRAGVLDYYNDFGG